MSTVTLLIKYRKEIENVVHSYLYITRGIESLSEEGDYEDFTDELDRVLLKLFLEKND